MCTQPLELAPPFKLCAVGAKMRLQMLSEKTMEKRSMRGMARGGVEVYVSSIRTRAFGRYIADGGCSRVAEKV